MPRIRKKTSNRASTNDRSKLRHKIAEGRKKNKKLAKKNTQWKSRVPKDPGIPSSMPFKDQVLAEIAESRRRAEEEKRLRKAGKGNAVTSETKVDIDSGDESGAEDTAGISDAVASVLKSRTTTSALPKRLKDVEPNAVDDEEPLLLDPSIPDLGHALDKADLWFHVLDARNPLTHRSTYLESLCVEKKKKLVFILNKIDLCPRESVTAWLGYLRTSHPTFPFRVSSSLLPPPEDNAKGKTKVSEKDGLGVDAIAQYIGLTASKSSSPLSIAVIGMPNSGKSSVINTLCGNSRLATYKPDTFKTTSTTTTIPQPIEYPTTTGSSRIQFIDTPGFDLSGSAAAGSNEAELILVQDSLLRSRGRIEKMRQPELAAHWIISNADQEDLILHYNTPAYLVSDPNGFLSGHARTTGRLKKGGVLDITDSARSVLRDWRVGKFPYYTNPPSSAASSTAPSDKALSDIYEKVDAAILLALRTRKEMRAEHGLIRMTSGTVDAREVILTAPVQAAVTEVSQTSSAKKLKAATSLAGAEESEDEAQTSEHGGTDEEEEADEDEEEELVEGPVKAPSKRKRMAKAPKSAPPTKKVSFATVQGRKGERKKPEVKLSKTPLVAKPTTKAVKGSKQTKEPRSTSNEAYDFAQYF